MLEGAEKEVLQELLDLARIEANYQFKLPWVNKAALENRILILARLKLKLLPDAFRYDAGPNAGKPKAIATKPVAVKPEAPPPKAKRPGWTPERRAKFEATWARKKASHG